MLRRTKFVLLGGGWWKKLSIWQFGRRGENKRKARLGRTLIDDRIRGTASGIDCVMLAAFATMAGMKSVDKLRV